MDFSSIDTNALALQLRKPHGDDGEKTGKAMAQFNASVNAFTLECMDVQPGDRILEIGFGPGEAIAEAVRLTPEGFVAGIDHSDTMLQMAEERNRRAVMQEHVELTLGDAQHLPYSDEAFDKVFAVNVFHFWEEPAKELAECMRVLAPSGKVFFYVTHPSSWLPGLEKTGVFIPREAADIEEILRKAGFNNVKSTPYHSNDGNGSVVSGTKA